MKITKQQLKQIIKEELEAIQEMGPEFPGEKLPRGGELDQALNPSLPSDVAEIEAQISDLLNSFQGLDAHGRYAEGGMLEAAQQHLLSLMKMVDQLKQGV